MPQARSSSPESSGARRCWRSSASWHRVWSAWRPAAVRIIGRVRLPSFGHTVKLMPPKYVKAYVKRGKTDAGDAAAICEAVMRPSMSFVPVKGLEQQGLSMLHSARSPLVGQRTQLINGVRGHLSELGIIAARGLLGLTELAAIVRNERDQRLPAIARAALVVLVRQIETISIEIAALDNRLRKENKASDL